MTFPFYRGSTILPTLEALAGDVGIVDAIEAKMRLSYAPNTIVPLTLTPRVDSPAGWDVTIDAAVSAGLQPGMWSLDAKLTIGDDEIVTDPLAINVISAASA